MTNLENKETIKQLNSQLSILSGKRNALVVNCTEIQKELSENKLKIKKIQQKINTLTDITNQELTISEHALLRYCERVLNIDIEDIKSKIITEELKKLIKQLGSTGIYPLNNCKLKIINNTIVTITN